MTTASAGSAAPRPRPAPAHRRILAHAALETRILLTNGEQLMVAILMPAMVLVALRLLDVGRVPGVDPINSAVAATAATALMATSFTSQAIQTGFDRRAGVLRWIAATWPGRSSPPSPFTWSRWSFSEYWLWPSAGDRVSVGSCSRSRSG
jgi:ABC-2 type transport system permease protein